LFSVCTKICDRYARFNGSDLTKPLQNSRFVTVHQLVQAWEYIGLELVL